MQKRADSENISQQGFLDDVLNQDPSEAGFDIDPNKLLSGVGITTLSLGSLLVTDSLEGTVGDVAQFASLSGAGIGLIQLSTSFGKIDSKDPEDIGDDKVSLNMNITPEQICDTENIPNQCVDLETGGELFVDDKLLPGTITLKSDYTVQNNLDTGVVLDVSLFAITEDGTRSIGPIKEQVSFSPGTTTLPFKLDIMHGKDVDKTWNFLLGLNKPGTNETLVANRVEKFDLTDVGDPAT